MNHIYNTNLDNQLHQSFIPYAINPFVKRKYDTIPNGVKTTMFIHPKFELGTDVYSRIITFEIPNRMYLYDLIVESTLTCTGDNSNAVEGLGTLLFEWIEIRQFGYTLCKVIPEYLRTRIDDAEKSLNEKYTALINPEPTFNATTSVVYTPIFSSFFEIPDNFINTDNIKGLEIVMKVAASKTAMGLPQDITDASYRLYCRHISTIEPQPLVDYNMLTYDIIEQRVAITSTTQEVKLNRVDKQVFATHLSVRDTELVRITGCKIFVDGVMIKDDTDRLNTLDVSYYGNTNSRIPSNVGGSSTYTIYWSMYNDRIRYTGGVNMTNIDITLELTMAGTGTLTIINEFWNELELNNGIFHRIT